MHTVCCGSDGAQKEPKPKHCQNPFFMYYLEIASPFFSASLFIRSSILTRYALALNLFGRIQVERQVFRSFAFINFYLARWVQRS